MDTLHPKPLTAILPLQVYCFNDVHVLLFLFDLRCALNKNQLLLFGFLKEVYTVKYLILKSRDVSRTRLHLCGNITD